MDWPFEHNVPKYPWNPRRLFMDGSVGFWLDFTDPTSWAQNSDGTVAATSLGDPVGFVRDKSGQGYNPTMTVASSRPTHGRMPKGGVRNRFTYTEQFDNAVWSKNGTTTVTANTTIAPDGTLTADTLSGASGATYTGSVLRRLHTSATSPWRTGIYVKSLGVATTISLFFRDGTTGIVTSRTLALNGSWQLLDQTVSSSNQGFWCLGAANGDVAIWGASAEGGTITNPYQKVAQAYDVTEAGVPSVPVLWFDGVDDFLNMSATAGALVRNAGRFTVFGAIENTKAMTVDQGIFFASTNVGTTTRAMLYTRSPGELAIGGRRLDADSFASAATPTSAFTPVVCTGIMAYSTADLYLRKDGALVTTTDPFQTSGNTSDTASTSVHIGRSGATYYGGFISGLVAVKDTTLTETQLLQTERFLMNQIGVAA